MVTTDLKKPLHMFLRYIYFIKLKQMETDLQYLSKTEIQRLIRPTFSFHRILLGVFLQGGFVITNYQVHNKNAI